MKKYRLKKYITEVDGKETSVYYKIQEKGFIFWGDPTYKTYTIKTSHGTETINLINYSNHIFNTVEEAEKFIYERLLTNNNIHYRGEKIDIIYHYNKDSKEMVYLWDSSDYLYIRGWGHTLDKVRADIDKEKDKGVIKYKTKIVKI